MTRGRLGSFRKKQLLAVGFWRLAGGELGSFRIFGAWHAVPVRGLGSFCNFGGGEIGFVSHIRQAGIGFVSRIWSWAGVKLGSFRIFGSVGWWWWGRLGSFRVIGGGGTPGIRELGSFRIIWVTSG